MRTALEDLDGGGAPHWDLSVKDWADRLRHGQPLIPKLPLITAEAELAVQFFDQLCLPDVPGRPLMRDACGQWFKDIIAALFGSWDVAQGLRFIEEVFCLVPKKNSKTTYGAGLMLVAMLMNQRPRAEFMFVGPTQAISDLAYSQASGMVEANPQLRERFWARDNLKSIDDRLNGSKLKIKTFDLDILTGPRPAGVLLDELHLLGRHSAAQKVIRQLRGGRQATPEGFMVVLTTQSDETPAGAFKSELNTARAIRDGKIPGKTLPVLYEFPPEIAKTEKNKPARWLDKKVWPMVLPNLGRSLDLRRLAEDFDLEATKGEGAVRLWASQHLNIEIGTTILDDNGWVGAGLWDEQHERGLTLDEIKERCEVVVAGIDGGGMDDLLALTVMGREKLTKHWLHWTHGWVDSKVVGIEGGKPGLRQELAPRLRDFQKGGDLTIVDHLGEDIDELVDILADLDKLDLLALVGLDPAGVGAIVDALADAGIGGAKDTSGVTQRVVGISQGWRLNGAILTVERKLRDGTLWHCGQPIMAWNCGNAKTEERGNAKLVTKAASGRAKIDNLMATFDAAALMAGNPQPIRRKNNDVNDFLKNAVVA